MSQTKAGAAKAAATIKAKNPNFYAEIGAKGGHISRGGGFTDDRSWFDKLVGKPSKASLAGRKGGMVSRRRKVTE